jgi:hypothetical protein
MELSEDPDDGQIPKRTQKKNTVLIALAMALLELYSGTTLESHLSREHGVVDLSIHQNPWTLCALAHDWAEEQSED